MNRETTPVSTTIATSAPTRYQKRGGMPWWLIACWTPLMMRAATQPPNTCPPGTSTRRSRPQVTTEGPDSHRIWSTGGTLRSARRRSPQGLSFFASGSASGFASGVASVCLFIVCAGSAGRGTHFCIAFVILRDFGLRCAHRGGSCEAPAAGQPCLLHRRVPVDCVQDERG